MLSQTTGYAVSALSFLATNGSRPVLVREIAEALALPPPYLAKIVNSLGRRGLVATQRGIGGGVHLARPAAEITVWDLCAALDDPVTQPRCLLALDGCSDEGACPAHEVWKVQREALWAFLKATSLADIAAFEAARGRVPLARTAVAAARARPGR
ncbi:MAG: Rrf2 family transcriptional regulator [Thermoanaerobaculia bacterium]|nr:Rrf2 family transcriptional regulator [Thermoanaerobaculia bacterium]